MFIDKTVAALYFGANKLINCPTIKISHSTYMDKKTVTDPKTLLSYLYPMAGAGEGGKWRSSQVGPCEGKWEEDTLEVLVRNSYLGEYTVKFTGAKLESYEDSWESNSTPSKEELATVIANCTWEVQTNTLYAAATNISGAFITLSFDTLSVEATPREELPDNYL